MLISWDEGIIVIFFFYGLAFYSLGLALLVESGRASELGFARSMRLLAGFGLLHGIHEWFDMFERAIEVFYAATFPMWLLWLRVALMVVSFIALLAFGEHLLFRERRSRPFRWRLTVGAIVWYALSVVIIQLIYRLSEADWLIAADVLGRYLMGVPGGLMACWALWTQRQTFLEYGMGRFVRDLMIAALALALYGVVGQLFTKSSAIFPSYILNEQLFQNLFGIPVQLFRALVAAVLAVSMIRVLRALEVENQQRMTAMKQAQLKAERISHQELTRLNAELQAANSQTASLLKEVQRRDSLRGELLQRITAAQEAERQRIARELHDETGQTLTGVALGLRGLASQLQNNPEMVAQQLPELEQMATTSLEGLRSLINDLRPPQLDDMGLAAALRWMVKRFHNHNQPQIELQVIGDPVPLAPDVETTLFRIAQEGLSNVIKHANASHACTILDYDDGPSLTVKDDGVGYDTDAVLNPNGVRTAWGLVGMLERASLINAELTLESKPGEGSQLTVRLHQDLPLEKELVDDHTRSDRR